MRGKETETKSRQNRGSLCNTMQVLDYQAVLNRVATPSAGAGAQLGVPPGFTAASGQGGLCLIAFILAWFYLTTMVQTLAASRLGYCEVLYMGQS